MIRRKTRLFYVIATVISIMVIASLFLLYYQSEKTLFPEKLGDMELKPHRDGDIAIKVHGRSNQKHR